MATKIGYNPRFLGRKNVLKVPLPSIPEEKQSLITPVKDDKQGILKYPNYSVILNAERKFPFFTASNIHGKQFRQISRKDLFKGGNDRWLKDRRIKYSQQWGSELYSARKSDFDKGHLVKREDVQWGRSNRAAKEGAVGTFYYTNAAPQHARMNRAIWSDIEKYILHSETVTFNLKISVFTGPVLRDDDPVFISKVRDEQVRIPSLYWKLIYYSKDNATVQRVAFLVGQLSLLESDEIVVPVVFDRDSEEENYFLDFDKADTYQVNTSLIESLTGLEFTPAIDSYHDDRPTKLILNEVNARGGGGSSVFIEGLVL